MPQAVVRPTPPPAPWAAPYLTVGVTGTNGKTSTTYLISHALRADGQSVVRETTLGYAIDDEELDVPRTARSYFEVLERAAARGCRRAAIEVTSEALARGFAQRWRYDVGVFTNLTRDHLDAHGSFEHYLASKAQLFVHLGPARTAVLNAADESSFLLDRVTPPDVARLWYAVRSRGELAHAADLEATDVCVGVDGTRVALAPSPLAESFGGELWVRLVGEVFAENALAAACAALASGVAPSDVARGLAACPGVPGRFEIVARTPVVAAVDYAHTPDALARTCDTARRLAGRARVVVVFGAGGGRDAGKREPMGRAVGERADEAVVTTDNPRREDPADISAEIARGCRRGGRAHVVLEPDRATAIERAIAGARAGDVVVVAGKGHERGQIVGGETRPFSDVDVVRSVVGT